MEQRRSKGWREKIGGSGGEQWQSPTGASKNKCFLRPVARPGHHICRHPSDTASVYFGVKRMLFLPSDEVFFFCLWTLVFYYGGIFIFKHLGVYFVEP